MALSFAKRSIEDRANTAPKGAFVFGHASIALFRAGPGAARATAAVLPRRPNSDSQIFAFSAIAEEAPYLAIGLVRDT